MTPSSDSPHSYDVIDVVPRVVNVRSERARRGFFSAWKGWGRLILGALAGGALLVSMIFAATFLIAFALILTAVFSLAHLLRGQESFSGIEKNRRSSQGRRG